MVEYVIGGEALFFFFLIYPEKKKRLALFERKGHFLPQLSFERRSLKWGASSMVEQLPFKQLVRGSNPRRPTTSKQLASQTNKSFAGFFVFSNE